MASQLVTQPTQLIDTAEVKGQGTILTGTVLHGSVKVNDNITLPVQGTTKKARVDGFSVEINFFRAYFTKASSQLTLAHFLDAAGGNTLNTLWVQ